MLQQTFGAAYAQGALMIDGKLDLVSLQRAVDAVVVKHEAFRTLFCSEPGVKVPLQVIVDECRPAWDVIELRESDGAEGLNDVLEGHRRQM